MTFALAAPTAAFGVYVSVRGHLTVGGGFQGGVIIASALVMLYLAGRHDIQEEVGGEKRLDLAEAIGAGGYLIVGLAGIVTAAAFLANVLPLGTTGDLISAGTIPVLSALIGIEAGAAVALLVSTFRTNRWSGKAVRERPGRCCALRRGRLAVGR